MGSFRKVGPGFQLKTLRCAWCFWEDSGAVDGAVDECHGSDMSNKMPQEIYNLQAAAFAGAAEVEARGRVFQVWGSFSSEPSCGKVGLQGKIRARKEKHHTSDFKGTTFPSVF